MLLRRLKDRNGIHVTTLLSPGSIVMFLNISNALFYLSILLMRFGNNLKGDFN